jgi:hypothetical protein
LLKEYHIRKGKRPESYSKEELPKLAKDDKDQEWEVKAIVDNQKQGKRQIKYLIK